MSTDLIPWLIKAAGGGSSDPDPILGSNALRVLGHILSTLHTHFPIESTTSPQILSALSPETIHQFLQVVAKYGDMGDESCHLACVDSITRFAAHSDESLNVVLSDPLVLPLLVTLPTRPPQKAYVLHSVAFIFSHLPQTPSEQHRGKQPPPPQQVRIVPHLWYPS